ncbi:MAG: peptide ABC transporter substrate-binding protein [Chlamydiae bacterium]|nr:peptide ABC transporter substrate-binding protein [Chlamydiota bacterium]
MTKLLKPTYLMPELSSENFKEDPISFPFKIAPKISSLIPSSILEDHVFYMERSLREAIPKEFYSKTTGEFIGNLRNSLPSVQWGFSNSPSDCLTVYLLAETIKEDETAYACLKLLKKWLIPGKRLTILTKHALSFRWNLFPGANFFLLEVKILLEESKNLSTIEQNLPSLAKEIISSIKERRYTKYILNSRPLSQDAKMEIVHNELIYLLNKYATYFDENLFKEMSRFLSLAPSSFCEPRPARLISKIVASHYIMRGSLQRSINLFPETRHLQIRYVKNELRFHFGSKPVLGLIMAVSIIDKHDFLEETHVEQAAQSLVPGVQSVKGSFYAFQGIDDPVRCLYVELEKKDGSYLSLTELTSLKKELEEALKRRIETLVPSIFMIRNEEETMRNILILSQELRYLSDLPQAMISLDRQTSSEIFFTVILVRLQKTSQHSIQKKFEKKCPSIRFIPDRLQQVGFLKKNSPKEANVFHLALLKDPSLLRADFSVNFYLARQRIVSLLTDALGHFRDYNGGMILKQGELFCQFKDSFPSLSEKNHELLENFFFSLNPIETQATLPLFSLSNLFNLFLEATKTELSKKDHYHLKIEEKKDQLFTLIRTQETSFKEELFASFSIREFSHKSLIQTHVTFQGSLYSGFILQSSDVKKQTLFIEAVHTAIQTWKTRLKNEQTLRLSFTDLPRTFDPRLGGDQTSCTLFKMLFEGLTRINKNGKPELALADSIAVSNDLRKYTFHLRKCYWSNGDLITAHDFEYAWKKIISPKFSTAFMYFFYPIKNAKNANEHKCSIDEVGIQVLDDETLEIELENPTPEFLELTAHTLYSPVNHSLDRRHPNWGSGEEEKFVCNGPFMIKKLVPGLRSTLIKNHMYWDKEQVKLEQILISKDNSFIANEMFKNDETDWLGKPLRAWEPFFSKNKEDLVSSTPMGIFWCVFNTSCYPFNHVKLRQALSYAIDRQHLVESLCYDALPASTPLPLSHTMNHDPREVSGNEEKALSLFEEALTELGLTRKTFPTITLIYSNSNIRESSSMFLAQEWQRLFGITCHVVGYEFHSCLNKLMKGDYQMGTLFWQSWIDNPLYTLNAFKEANHEINFAKWSNVDYSTLLDKAQQEIDPLMRIKYLAEAERILIKEKPVLPIFYEKERNIKKQHLKNVYYSQTTGYVDFKCSYIDR